MSQRNWNSNQGSSRNEGRNRDQFDSVKRMKASKNPPNQEKEGQTQTPEEPIVSMSQSMSHPSSERFQRKLKFLLACKIEPIKRKRENMANITLRNPCVTHWVDNLMLQKPCFNLRIMNDQEICNMGDEIFSNIISGVNLKSICCLMLLAFQLKDTLGNRAFDEVTPEMCNAEETEEFDEVDDKALINSTMIDTVRDSLSSNDENRIQKKAIAYSFMAASYLRMYTKSAENYSKIHKHLTDKFRGFYSFDFPLTNVKPSIETIRVIKHHLGMHARLRNTLYVLMYCGENNDNGKDLKEFLYVVHLAYTGLHSVVLFFGCLEVLGVDHARFLDAMDQKMFKNQLDCLDIVCKNFLANSKSDDQKRQMWRFGRLYDPDFLNTLQTKNCRKFTAILAYCYDMSVASPGTSRVMEIAQLQYMGEGDKEYARLAAAHLKRRVEMELVDAS